MSLPDEPWIPSGVWQAAADSPVFAEGVTTAWVVAWDGAPGPAHLMQVTVLADGSGYFAVEPTGEWKDTTVVDDREET